LERETDDFAGSFVYKDLAVPLVRYFLIRAENLSIARAPGLITYCWLLLWQEF